MSFRIFIESTVAQKLKTMKVDDRIRNQVFTLMDTMKTVWGMGILNNDKNASLISNWLLYRFMVEDNTPYDLERTAFNPWAVRIMQHNRDYITSAINGDLRQKFQDLNYGSGNLAADTTAYHERLARQREIDGATGGKKMNRGAPGLPIVLIDKELEKHSVSPELLDKKADDFGNPNEEMRQWEPAYWKGWRWESLGRHYCPEEAAAMGHCGNEGGTIKDNIVSLRDPQGRVHLTFIISEGGVGEAKGLDNEKPSRFYHAPIVALYLSKYVNWHKGGGYLPENNFDPKKDLDYAPRIKELVNGTGMHEDKDFEKPVNLMDYYNILGLGWNDIHKMNAHQQYDVLMRLMAFWEDDNNLFERDMPRVGWFWTAWSNVAQNARSNALLGLLRYANDLYRSTVENPDEDELANWETGIEELLNNMKKAGTSVKRRALETLEGYVKRSFNTGNKSHIEKVKNTCIDFIDEITASVPYEQIKNDDYKIATFAQLYLRDKFADGGFYQVKIGEDEIEIDFNQLMLIVDVENHFGFPQIAEKTAEMIYEKAPSRFLTQGELNTKILTMFREVIQDLLYGEIHNTYIEEEKMYFNFDKIIHGDGSRSNGKFEVRISDWAGKLKLKEALDKFQYKPYIAGIIENLTPELTKPPVEILERYEGVERYKAFIIKGMSDLDFYAK